MARSRSRKKAPKAAPMIDVYDVEKAPVKDSKGEDILYEVKRRVRADGSEPKPKTKKIVEDVTRTNKKTGVTVVTKPGNKTGRTVKKFGGKVENDAAVAAHVEDLKAARAAGETKPGSVADYIGKTGDKSAVIPIDTTVDTYVPSASEELEDQDVQRKFGSTFRGRQLKDFGDLTATRQSKLAEHVQQVTGKNVAPRKRKSMRVSKAATEMINTATVPEAGTTAGQRPAAPYLGDGGNGGSIKIGRGAGAPLAPADPNWGNRRSLRSKESIRISRSRAANKIPKMGAGNYDPNNAIYAGERPHENLVREQKRGVGGKQFTRLLTESNSSGVSYHETTDPARMNNVMKIISDGTKSTVEQQARHVAKSSKAGYLEPGSIGQQPALPIKNTDEAKMARTAFFGQQARQHDINTKATALTRSNRASAKNLGLKANPNASDDEAIRLGATSGEHSGLYGAGKDIKHAVAVRDRYVRKYGHKLSDDAINKLPGIDREQAVDLSAQGEAEKKSKSVGYYMGQNSAGDTRYNKGLEKTKLQEIAYHTKQKVSHVASWIKSTGVDVHQLHKDLSEQVYSPGVAKKAWVPTSDPVQTHRMVEYHPSGRVKSRRGRTKEGANLPRHWTEIQKSPGSDAGTLTHSQYISHKIAEHMETKPFRNKLNDRGSKQTIATAITAGTGGDLPQRQAIQTPFGSSEDVIKRNEGPGKVEITQEGKQLGRGRAY